MFAFALDAAFFGLAFAGMVLLVRKRLPPSTASVWLDGVIASLGLLSIASALFCRAADEISVDSLISLIQATGLPGLDRPGAPVDFLWQLARLGTVMVRTLSVIEPFLQPVREPEPEPESA
ncbi:hypothetical protein [Cryobacterium sp. GrIS_2_6]|uniref:hypothetical protein n=1 Tax=Cryobacterium sp. GrIS_2_6 TaxID=3162785 RepID=UPI002DFE4BEE|nr:hypothetical protein [Cryobacterium psychrotolerans]